MPEARNCRRCGKVYTYMGGQMICSDCKQDDEIIFKKIKNYLYEHPGASMSQVSNDLEVSVARIKSYLKEGRLEIIGDGNMILECESCGKPINSGRYCQNCFDQVGKQLKSVASSMAADMQPTTSESNASKKESGMRYLTRDQKK